ncbi:hypothetical protein ACQUQP_14355 [Marinobacterium sp. YM272]
MLRSSKSPVSDLPYRLNLALFNPRKAEGIEIPFPQREVRLLNPPSAA